MTEDNKDGRPQPPAAMPKFGLADPVETGKAPLAAPIADVQTGDADRKAIENGETNGNADVETGGDGSEDKAARQARTTGGQQGSTTP